MPGVARHTRKQDMMIASSERKMPAKQWKVNKKHSLRIYCLSKSGWAPAARTPPERRQGAPSRRPAAARVSSGGPRRERAPHERLPQPVGDPSGVSVSGRCLLAFHLLDGFPHLVTMGGIWGLLLIGSCGVELGTLPLIKQFPPKTLRCSFLCALAFSLTWSLQAPCLPQSAPVFSAAPRLSHMM